MNNWFGQYSSYKKHKNIQYNIPWKTVTKPIQEHTELYPDGSSRERAIVSYGIIIYSKDSDTINVSELDGSNTSLALDANDVSRKYLVIQRRDTFEYMDFLRGLWTSYINPEFLFSKMTTEERDRLLKYSFNDLWKDLWIHDYGIAKDGRNKAIGRYNLVYNRIPLIVSSTKNIDAAGYIITEPPWGFPKGKKSGKESHIDCAIREAREETRLNITRDMILDIDPVVERFRGSDNKEYITMYYIAYYPKVEIPTRLEIKDCIRTSMISEEVENIRWLTKTDALKLLDINKRDVLERVDEILSK